MTMPYKRLYERFQITVRSNNEVEAKRIQPQRSDIVVHKYSIDLEPLRLETIQVLIRMLRSNRLRTDDEIRVLGHNLYSALFSDQTSKELNDLLNDPDPEWRSLSVELVFEGQQELASWPWEYLYCPTNPEQAGTGYFLTQLDRLILTRHLVLNTEARPLGVSKPPVKVLFVAANPDPDELGPVSYKALLEELVENSPDKIQVTELVGDRSSEPENRATLKNFLNLAAGIEPHVIHFIGHGQYTENGGEIAFVGEHQRTDWIQDRDLAVQLWQIKSLRLVFLQACESALPNPYQAVSGVAMRLAHMNIPAVVAMQYQVEKVVASGFARAFYKALTQPESVAAAVQAGRKEIGLPVVPTWRSFGLPVLYLREVGGLLLPGTETLEIAQGQQVPGGLPYHPHCPWCSKPYDASDNSCGSCQGPLKCPHCGAEVKKASKGCVKCGKTLRQEDGRRDAFSA